MTLRSFFRTMLRVGLLSSSLSLVLPGLHGARAEERNPGDKNSELVFLLVDKTRLKADLLTWPEDGQKSEKLISFRIAIGKETGDKQKSGDNRTPEGIYFAKGILNKGLPSKYGPVAIPIDFPNPLDKFLGKTGYGIWLHGVEQDSRIEAANVTEGCVAFYNADIQSLSQWLVPAESIIVIAKDATQVNRHEDVEQVRNLVGEWTEAWNKRDVDSYISFFIPNFRSFDKKMNLKNYKKYKTRVFASYSEMSVQMKDLRVFTHDRYAVAIMNQDFAGDDRYHVTGRKVLYWQRTEQGGWKLFHEEFDERPMRFTNLARDKIAQIIKSSPSTKFLQEARESKL